MSPLIMILSLLVLILATSPIEGIYECCPGENILSMTAKRCSTNDNISLECIGPRFPVFNVSQFNDFNYLIIDNGTLIDQSTNVEIKYCHSYTDDDTSNTSSHMYIVCYIKADDSFESKKIQLTAILGYISVAFTILTIIVYAMVPKLLDLQGICIMHTLVGLAGGYTCLGVIQLSTSHLDSTLCYTLALMTYFCFMYMFFWLNTLSFHIWRTTVNPIFSVWTTKWTRIYHIFAIGGAVAFFIFLLLAHHSTSEIWDDIRPGLGDSYCWFRSIRETMIFFYGPIAVLLLINAFFYLWTVIVLWRQMENRKNKILKYRFKLCVRLSIIMGITWIFEIITAVLTYPQMSLVGKILFFLLDLFNILQGVLIFLVLVVFRKRVHRALASKNICNIEFPNSWKYLEDEEMESGEIRANSTVTEYKGNNVEIKR